MPQFSQTSLDRLATTHPDLQRLMKEVDETKACITCGIVKPLTGFGKDSKRPDRHRGSCNQCRNEYLKKWGARNPMKKRAQKWRHRYGIDMPEYRAMWETQQGGCGICGKRMPGWYDVDHSHETGKVRGLLCRRCNTALGHFLSSDMLQRAMSYLERAV